MSSSKLTSTRIPIRTSAGGQPTTLLSIAHQQELARLGVFFERCFTTPNTGKIAWEQVYANIREVGPASTILATDLGQTTAPYPDEGLGTFMYSFNSDLTASPANSAHGFMIGASRRAVI